MWKAAFERIVVGGQGVARSGFEMMAYAGLALENLRDVKNEGSEQLFHGEMGLFGESVVRVGRIDGMRGGGVGCCGCDYV